MKEFQYIFSTEKRFEQVELSKINELKKNHVLIKPKKIGICGSDLFHMTNMKTEKLYLGHEWVGEVELSSSPNFSKGDIVTSCATLGCGECEYCKNSEENYCQNSIQLGSDKIGMLRSHIELDARHLLKLPSTDLDTGALMEVAGIGFEAIKKLTEPSKVDDTILILGAGPVGLMTALAVQEKDLNFHIVETEPFRIHIAKQMFPNQEISSIGSLLLLKQKFKYFVDCTGDTPNKLGAWQYFYNILKINATGIIVGHYHKKWDLNSKIFGNLSLNIRWMKGMPIVSLKECIDKLYNIVEKNKKYFIHQEYELSQLDEAFSIAADKSKSIKVLISI